MPKLAPKVKDIHTVVFDFDGVFTDNKVWVDQDGRESVCCDRGDGLAFDMVRYFTEHKGLDVRFFVLSKESNPVVLTRTKKLKLECHHGVGNKLDFIGQYLKESFPNEPNPYAGLVYVGNDLNDLPVMRRAGFAVAPSDAHPKVAEIAHWVLEQKGGHGFVRAFIESLLEINKLSCEEIDEFISNC